MYAICRQRVLMASRNGLLQVDGRNTAGEEAIVLKSELRIFHPEAIAYQGGRPHHQPPASKRIYGC